LYTTRSSSDLTFKHYVQVGHQAVKVGEVLDPRCFFNLACRFSSAVAPCGIS